MPYLKLVPKVTEFLVGDGLDGRCVDGPCAVLGSQSHGILCHYSLACARVRCHKDAIALQGHKQIISVSGPKVAAVVQMKDVFSVQHFPT